MAGKKKSGRIAVPFLVTVFLGLIIVGGAAWWIFNYLNKEEELPMPSARKGEVTASYEDRHTVLFVLDTPEQNSKTTFMIMRSVPDIKQILFIGIPSNSTAVLEETGRQTNLETVYSESGAPGAVNFIDEALGIEIDRYMRLSSDTFRRICDMFGGVNYPIDVDILGLHGDGTFQTMNAEQIETYITYSKFKGGEVDRATNAALIMQYLVNGADGERIADSFDRYFEEIINSVTSDITAVDYQNRRGAIKYMFNFGSTIAIGCGVDGTTSEKDFIPSRNFISNLPAEYFGTPEDSDNS